MKKPRPLFKKNGNNKNIGKLGITNQNIWVLKIEILFKSLVSNHIHVSETIDTSGIAIIIADNKVDFLLTSVATRIIKADIKNLTIWNVGIIIKKYI